MPHRTRVEEANPSASSKKLNSGFTLIEMLAVIALIGVLAAILIPVIGTVRDRAQASGCQNNLRQIGIGLQLYMQDNELRFPGPLYAIQPTFYKEGTTTSLLYHLVPYLDLPPVTSNKQYSELFACPTYLAEKPIYEDPRSYMVPATRGTGYPFGYPGGGQMPKTLYYIQDQHDLSDTWILRDIGGSSRANLMDENPHRDGNNCLYLDGSVRIVPFEETP